MDARDSRHTKVVIATIVIDVGKPINPFGIEAQMMGGLSGAISRISNAGLTFSDGLPLETSYANFRFFSRCGTF